MTLRRFIIASTFIGLFSSRAAFGVGAVHFLFFYVLIAVNLVLMWAEGYSWLPSGMAFTLAFVLFTGLIGTLQGTDTLALVLKSYVGILLSGVYFCTFIRYMRFDVEKAFELYARVAYYAAMFGILWMPGQIALVGVTRLASVMTEPAAFALVACPAIYYYADQWQRQGTGGWRCIVLLVATIMTLSSSGFMGIFLGLLLFLRRFRFGNVLGPIIVMLMAVAVYVSSDDFRVRYDDTVRGLAAADTRATNLSSFAIISNTFVTTRLLSEHPLFGGGLGSHPLSHARYVGDVSGIADYLSEETDYTELNATDAGSLCLRILSEMGLVGMGLALGFLIWFYPRQVSPARQAISASILTYVLMKFLRSGIYFDPEEFFFILVYAVNGMHRLRYTSLQTTRLAPLSLEMGRSA